MKSIVLPTIRTPVDNADELDDAAGSINPDEPEIVDSDDNLNVHESDSEMDSFNPSPLCGTTTEDAEAWLRCFNNFCTYKEFNADKSKALFKVLLVDSAASWLESVDAATANNWTALQAAFKARYTTASFLKYQHANELFNKKQDKESVDDFCAKMQNLAKQINADEQMLRFAI